MKTFKLNTALLIGILAVSACTTMTRLPSISELGNGKGKIPIATEVQDINVIRLQNDLPALKPSWKASQAAQSHAKDMFDNDFLSYTGTDGAGTAARMERNGCTGAHAENIGRGYASREDAMAAWTASPDHLGNILMKDVNVYAIENVEHVWVMVVANTCE